MPTLRGGRPGDDVLARLARPVKTADARLGVALAAGVTVVVMAPFVGQIRGAAQAALPGGAYRALVAAVVLAALLTALVYGLARIREHRARRYGSLALALAIGAGYARWSGTGNASVDLVEHFHFVEYGLLTLLFYRVWRGSGGVFALAAPALCVMVIGTLDEWLQWFVPLRVGEMRDVALNGVAIGCGLLFATGVEPLPHVRHSGPASRAVRLLPAGALLTMAIFFHVVHLAYDVDAGQGTRFKSRFTAEALDTEARARADRWRRDGPPLELRRVSREDQYLAEGLWHVQRRNEASAAGDAFAASRENLILERFFGPVLDWPFYMASSTSRWPQEQREAAAREAADPLPYVSQAERYPLYAWDRTVYWSVVVTLAALLLALGRARTRLPGPAPDSRPVAV